MCLPRFGCSETQWTQGFWGPAACAGEATGGTQTTHERRAIADSRGARPPVAEHSSRTKGGQQTRGSDQRKRPGNLSDMPSAGISTSAPRTPIRVGFRTSDMPRGQSQGVESNGQGVRAAPRYEWSPDRDAETAGAVRGIRRRIDRCKLRFHHWHAGRQPAPTRHSVHEEASRRFGNPRANRETDHASLRAGSI